MCIKFTVYKKYCQFSVSVDVSFIQVSNNKLKMLYTEIQSAVCCVDLLYVPASETTQDNEGHETLGDNKRRETLGDNERRETLGGNSQTVISL